MELFINDHRADISSSTTFAFTFQDTDTNSPEAIKNPFSKSVTLQGTPNNNKIFDEIYDLSRITANQFNPRKRVPFTLLQDGNVVESGYLKLDSIQRVYNSISYNLTLYGTLGDFFYNLAQDENGNERSLSDLYFGLYDEYNHLLSKEEEEKNILFLWNRDTIHSMWTLDDLDMLPENSIYKVFKAVPTLSGKHEDFDNDKVLINTAHLSAGTESLLPEISGYSTAKGWALATLPREVNEFEVSDLRSCYQRPAVRLKTILEAISNPANNGGYEVIWDDDITNVNGELGDYYNKSYLLLNQLDFDDADKGLNSEITIDFGDIMILDESHLSGETYFQDEGGNINLDLSGMKNPNVKLSFFPKTSGNTEGDNKMCFTTCTQRLYQRADDVYMGYVIGGIGYQATLYIDDVETYTSNWYLFIASDGFTPIEQYNILKSDWRDDLAQQLGATKDDVVMMYNTMLTNASGHGLYMSPTPVEIEMPSLASSNVKIKLTAKAVQTSNLVDKSFKAISMGSGTTMRIWTDQFVEKVHHTTFSLENINNESQIYNGGILPSVQKTAVNKRILFSEKGTPLDYLLGFTKMLGLKFRVDKTKNIIYIERREKYYKNEIIDISHDIDRKKEILIDPILSKYKWVKYGLDMPETYASMLYNRKHKDEYGTLMVNTGYEFNNDTNDMFANSVYKAAIPYRLLSFYFNDTVCTENECHQCLLSPSFEYTLFKEGEDGYESSAVTTSGLGSKVRIEQAYDNPKLCCMDADNNNVDDLYNSLVFFDGWTTNGYGNYLLTDNLPVMYELNDKPCFICTETSDLGYPSVSATQESTVAIRLDKIPVFSKYLTYPNGTYKSSWDFAKPQSTFIGDMQNYSDGITIYERFWQTYIQDLYDADNKLVDIYCKLLLEPQEAMRRFFYFDNQIWVINKITDWSPDKIFVKCQFLKVKDKRNYLGHGDTVTLSSINRNGHVEGTGTYSRYTTATARAVPDTGYIFVEWSDGGTEATRNIYMDEDKVVYPVFQSSGDILLVTPPNISVKFDELAAEATITYTGDGTLTVESDSEWLNGTIQDI